MPVVKKEVVPSLKDIAKKFGQAHHQFFKSGVPNFDLLLTNNKGIQEGKFIELTSATGLGKTTFLLYIASYICNTLKRKVLFIDSEKGVTQDILSKLRLDKPIEDGLFILIQVSTFDSVDQVMRSGFEDPELSIIIVDSISAMIASKQMDKSIESTEIGLQSRMQGALLGKYRGYIDEGSGKTVFWVTQRRAAINIGGGGGNYAPKTRSAVGNAFEFAMDARIHITRRKKIKQLKSTLNGSEEVEIGAETWFTCFKNRLGGACFVQVYIPILFGKGVSNVLALKENMVKNKFVTSGGAWYTVNLGKFKDVKINGQEQLIQWIKENYTDVLEAVYEAGGMYLVKE